jgi:hypothetical protein
LKAQRWFPGPRPHVANHQPAFPDPARLPFNTPQPPARRNQPGRSLASKVRMRPEPLAIAASKACKRSPTPRQFLIQHRLRGRHRQRPPAGAVIETMAVGVNFLFL